MKIAIIHGYLLSGTGSNIYVANLTSELVKKGHEVFLFCQEPAPLDCDFLCACYDFEADNRRFFPVFERAPIGPGSARLFRPRIGRILPVYVYDDYDGFTPREFHLLGPDEIEDYVSRNAAAVNTVYQSFAFDVAQANHLIAQPAVARRALATHKIPYHVTIHGSALNYSVKRNPGLDPLALYGLDGAASVCASSSFLGQQLNEYLDARNHAPVKVHTIYPGVELALFKPTTNSDKQALSLASKLDKISSTGKTSAQKQVLRAVVKEGRQHRLDNELNTPCAYNRRLFDQDLAKTLRLIDWAKDGVVIFTGKYLAAKGLHAAILAAPMVLSRRPNTKFLAVGFSEHRELFEALVAALGYGASRFVLPLVIRIENDGHNDIGRRFIAQLKENGNLDDYFQTAVETNLIDNFLFTGPLSHDQLAQLLPSANLSISPSIFPEAFGMVAIEALACGVYPIVTNAFGMAEIRTIVDSGLEKFVKDMPSLKLDNHFIDLLAFTIVSALRADVLRQTEFKEAAHELASDLFNWKRLTAHYLELFKTPKPQAA